MAKSKAFSERALELVGIYRNNPVIAAEDLLNADLDTPQKIIVEEAWYKPYVIVSAARGAGKSFLLSLLSALYAMLYPGRRVIILSPSFRQSKGVFFELKKRYTESPIFRESCSKKPIVSSDRCYTDLYGVGDRPGSSIEAYPLGTGEKIRGLRSHLLLVDEFAQIPQDIFETVIRPMGATTISPMAKVRKIQKLKEQRDTGILTQEQYEMELEEGQANKIIGVTSAYYQFNHVYQRILKYQEQIDKGSKKYGLVNISYEDMSEGFLDRDNVMEAKATMGRTEFNLEYRAVWESDSDGIFKASLLEKCKSRDTQVRLKGQPGKKYIIGVDPARSSDSFAVAIIEVGNPSSVVAAFEATGKRFPAMAQKIYDFSQKYDAQIIMMDAGAGGGGVAIKDILSSEQFSSGRLILDMDDEDHKHLTGRRILRMHVPSSKTVAEANYAALNILEQGRLTLPMPPTDFNEDKEEVYEHIKTMLQQMMAVVVTETKSGQAHFDIPASGSGSRKKDLYSAFVLAAKGLYDSIIARDDDTSYVNRGGLVIPKDRLLNAPSIAGIVGIPGDGYGRTR